MDQLLFLFNLIGSFAFAAYGAYVAQKKHLDLFGILAIGTIAALGGGTIRDVILGQVPFYLTDNSYFIAVLVGCAFSIAAYRWFHKITVFMLIIDALGLAAFAYTGAAAGGAAHLSVLGITFMAVVTAVGGGLLRDISVARVPLIYHSDFYATPAILLGVVYGLSGSYQESVVFAYILIAGAFLLRLVGVLFDLKLWKPVQGR